MKIENEKSLVGGELIKSKSRVREQAEVYTGAEQVTAMLDLVRDCSDNIDSRFLEPACGNGNFLVVILNRKMEVVATRFKKQKDFEYYSLVALSSIYGVDIDKENVKEARERLRLRLVDWFSYKLNTKKPSAGFFDSVDYILKKNVIHGDMLNGTAKIKFSEFSSPKSYYFKEKVFALTDMLNSGPGSLLSAKPKPLSESTIRPFLELKGVS